MEDVERQQLLDQIANQAAEIAQLKQTTDALIRRIFGAKNEALDPAHLELLLGFDLTKKAPAAVPADPAPAAEISSHKSPPRKQARVPRTPSTCPSARKKSSSPPKSSPTPPPSVESVRKSANNSTISAAASAASAPSAPSMSKSATF